MKTKFKKLLYGILAAGYLCLSYTSLTCAAEDYQWPPKDGEPIVTLVGPFYETGRETKAPLFKELEQAMTSIVKNQQKHLPEFYQKNIAGMNHQLFRPGYSNDEEWGSIKSLGSKAEDYNKESMAGILETSEYRKPGLEMAIRMQPTIEPQPDSVTLEGYRLILQPGGKGQAEWFTQVVKLKGRNRDEAFRNALIWELVKPFEILQKSFVMKDLDVPVWKDKNTAGVMTFADKQFTADPEPVRKETVEVCVQTRFCQEMNVKGDEFALVSKIADAQAICRIFGRELIDKETLLRLSLTEEGSNLLDEENGAAWHSGGESGYFEENYNHHDFIPVGIPSETAGRSQSGVVWCRTQVRDTYEFKQRDKNFVIERGLWTIELYSPNFSSTTNELGHKILDNELVVEYIEFDEVYPDIWKARILKNSFSDVPKQGDIVRNDSPGPEWRRGFGLERYTIDLILSGTDWEREISSVPVSRLVFTGVPISIFSGKRVHVDLGLSTPSLEVDAIDFDQTDSVTGGTSFFGNIGLGGYLKVIPNIGWNVSLGMDNLKFINSNGEEGGGAVNIVILDARLLFQYKSFTFSLGQINYQSGDVKFNSEVGKPDLLANKVSIPAGTSLLMGINFGY